MFGRFFIFVIFSFRLIYSRLLSSKTIVIGFLLGYNWVIYYQRREVWILETHVVLLNPAKI